MICSGCPRGRLLAALAALLLAGCTSSPDVKLASAQMTSALGELQTSIAAFQRLYLSELAKTRAEIGAAIVARSVRKRIEELSASFEDADWQTRFETRGLIALSEEIEATQDAARRLVGVISQVEVEPGEDVEAILDSLTPAQAENLRTSARSLREGGFVAEAEVLLQRAEALESGDLPAFPDPWYRAYFKALLELGASQAEIPQNLEQLRKLVGVLQETHAVVHDWIMTDVKVAGSEVGDLLTRHADALGLGAPAPEGGGS